MYVNTCRRADMYLNLRNVFNCKKFFNTRIYNLSSAPHITRFSAVVVKKRKNFE